MSWIGKIVGGTIGWVVGGPVGGIIGAGLGHLFDAAGTDSAEPTPGGQSRKSFVATAKITSDKEGLFVEYAISAPNFPRIVAVTTIKGLDREFVQGRAPFLSPSGDFFVSAPVSNGGCEVYLPFGAMQITSGGTCRLRLTLLALQSRQDAPINLGTEWFEIDLPAPETPPGPHWNRCGWLAPLIDLCMTVVHADEQVRPEEIRLVRAYLESLFELGPEDARDLKEALKRTPPTDLESTLTRVFMRLPTISPAELLALLSDIARCDLEVHAFEVAMIQKIALLLGIPTSEWKRVARELGLEEGPARGAAEARSRRRSGEMSLEEACRILGVSRDASRGEILAAYRKLVSQYHPDRVANMSESVQKEAHDKMTQINAAYEVAGKRQK